MRLSLNNNGYGVAVIQRLCKTSVKKNLYWEIKDKVIEEEFDGTRNIKRTAKVKVYGLDSNKQVRARLMEILVDRVRYHKDKFIVPVFHQELCGLQWKKERIDHSTNTHDDNLFSLLMALYVWYDGKDLVEKFGVYKGSIKTDEEVEIVDGDIETAEEKKIKMDLHQLEYDDSDIENSEVAAAYQFLEDTKNFTTPAEFNEQNKLNEMIMRDNLLTYNEQARKAYCNKNGLDPDNFMNSRIGINNAMTTLPDNLFGGVDTDDDSMFSMNPSVDDTGLRLNTSGTDHLAGNLSSLWNQL